MKYHILLFILSIFLLSNCNSDTCEELGCNNGGTCINEVCNCPNGWTGPDCSEIEPPVSFEILTIAIDNIPQLRDDGSPWDESDGPELIGFWILEDDVLISSTSLEDVNNFTGTSIEMLPLNPFTLPIEFIGSKTLEFQLFDFDDVDSLEKMFTIEFVPEFYLQGVNNNCISGTVVQGDANVTAEMKIMHKF